MKKTIVTKITALSFITALTLSIAGCGSGDTKQDTQQNTSDLGMIQEVSDLSDATIELSEDFIGDELNQILGKQDSADANNQESNAQSSGQTKQTEDDGQSQNNTDLGNTSDSTGASSSVISDDSGTVKVDFTGEDRTAVVNEVAKEIEDSIKQILGDDLYYPNITDIKVNSDCTEFTIYLSSDEPNIYESMLMMSFYIVGNKYQTYNGVDAADVLTTVIYVNSSTGAELARSSSNEMSY